MPRKKGKKKFLRLRKILFCVLIAIAALLAFLTIYSLTVISQAPKIDPDNIYSNLQESSILYDDSGKAFDRIYKGGGNRENIDYDRIPQDMVNAIVATEDKTFWTHHGFNFIRMAGAVRERLSGGGSISGTSTITQQLARNVYLPDTKSERSLKRKLSEAWYAFLIEKHLSKDEIMEAYLNSIYFGFNSYGIQAAAHSYFSKDAEDLDLAECAALAAIPKSPSSYSLVMTLDRNTGESKALELKDSDVLRTTDSYDIVYNGDVSKDRRHLILKNMKDQGYITDEEYRTAENEDIRSDIDLSGTDPSNDSAYMSSYVTEQIKHDLEDSGYSEKTAERMIYSGGLKIHTTLDPNVQSALNAAFSENSSFPAAAGMKYDGSGNIVSDSGRIQLYKYSNLIDDSGRIALSGNKWNENDDGDIILSENGFIDFRKKNGGITAALKKMYVYENGTLFTVSDTTLLIPDKYKSIDSSGDLVIDRSYMNDYPDLVYTENGSLYFSRDAYTPGEKTAQPQGAMVIIDYRTGEIKGMIGGRGSSSRLSYNRAASRRQPGSAIKPLSVYSTALQQGADAAAADTGSAAAANPDETVSTHGKYWTAASMINDAPLTVNGKPWPRNWYNGYRGMMTLRKSVEQSVNTSAVRVLNDIGTDKAMEQLEKFGITSVKHTGTKNDDNAAALALGGMVSGISPVQMASAYGTFPNRGIHISPRCYTSVEDKEGNTILSKEEKNTKVMDESVSFIMTDILRTTVRNGVAREASMPGLVAGKTGTTTDQKDAWFCGFTPKYSAACWIGNDSGMELDAGSEAACRLWKNVMERIGGSTEGSFPQMPSDVVKYGGEYYVRGTQPR